MNPETLKTIVDIADVFVKGAVLIGGIWAVYKVTQYRELKQRIQLDIDANLFPLSLPEEAATYNWDREGNRVKTPLQQKTHAIEILLKFTNKGFTRMRLYNIQVAANSMRPQNKAEFDEDDGHLHLTRIFSSGNIVPKFTAKDKSVEKTSFYYIEPGIEQTITYLALITKPRELIQIYAKFSLEQERIFPKKDIGPKGVYPHTSARTYQVNPEGLFVR